MSRLGEFVYGGIARLGREETGIFNILFFFFDNFTHTSSLRPGFRTYIFPCSHCANTLGCVRITPPKGASSGATRVAHYPWLSGVRERSTTCKTVVFAYRFIFVVFSYF
jgi:hypothetical protein